MLTAPSDESSGTLVQPLIFPVLAELPSYRAARVGTMEARLAHANVCHYGRIQSGNLGDIMQRISDEELRSQFLSWQCRIRQIAMREHGGEPSPGMRPRVLAATGETLLAAMTILIHHDDPHESIAFFRFQVQKTPDPRRVYETVLQYLQSEHYRVSNHFSDEMTALFEPGSQTAAKLVKARHCLLEFEQFSQAWRLSCTVRRLPARSPARQATLWHNRAFNPAIPSSAVVLGFKPAWGSAAASPPPPGH